jgi:CubicO group peptidase (beta-lactamase class C family)
MRTEARRSRAWIVLPAAGLLLLVAAAVASRADRAPRVATALVSHTLCSEFFLAGLDPDQVYAETFGAFPGIRWIDWALRYKVDRATREVSATLLGGFASRAVYRDGSGCRLVHGEDAGAAPAERPTAALHAAPLAPEIAVVEPADAPLRAALDRIFAPADEPAQRRTKAVVVLHDRRVVAERYAPGYGIDTPLLGWSTSKSIVSALIGILVRERRLALDAPAPVAAWRAPGDPRGAITLDQLLRMTSGLALDETNTGFDPVSRMLFLEDDMAGFATSAPLAAKPGTVWRYSGGNTLILSRLVRDAAGGAEEARRFARRELFDPLGMRDVTIETDATGTPVGSTYILASARDWARFGMLYLDDGVVGGRRILPENWVRYSASRTLDSTYAAGFWLGPEAWRVHVPADTFFAAGLLGQRVVIIPSERLVIARFGVFHGPTGDMPALARFIAEVIAALHAPGR